MSTASWSPLLEPSLLAWWSADVGVSTTGSNVIGWTDRSPGRTGFTASASAPVYAAVGWNGMRPELTFSAANSMKALAGSAIRAYAAGAPISIYGVVDTTSTATAKYILQIANGPNVYGAFVDASNHLNFDVNTGTIVHGTVSMVGKRVFSLEYTGTSVSGWVDGGLDISSAAASSTPFTAAEVDLGANGGGGSLFSGAIAELAVFTSVAGRQAQWRAYAQQRWPGL
jgi:hypothetical protein